VRWSHPRWMRVNVVVTDPDPVQSGGLGFILAIADPFCQLPPGTARLRSAHAFPLRCVSHQASALCPSCFRLDFCCHRSLGPPSSSRAKSDSGLRLFSYRYQVTRTVPRARFSACLFCPVLFLHCSGVALANLSY
jgi:hypothetical protein